MDGTLQESAVRIIEILESEDGETGWATGHVEPALMVLSTVVERMQNNDPESAFAVLLGRQTRYTEGPDRWTIDDQVAQANKMIRSVRHVWLVQDADADEKMHPANEGDAGAEPFTRVEIPW